MSLFDDPRFRKPAASLLMAFATASSAATPPAGEPEGETLWKTKTFDAVVSLKPCPESGMCGYLYWLNADDTKLFDYFGDPKVKSERGDFPGVTRADIEALCGFSPKMNFTQAADKPDHWQGRMEMRGMGMTVNVDASKISDRELRVVTSKAFFGRTETWTRVDKDDPKYPKCRL